MPKDTHTLFVCKSCHRSSEERAENQPYDGTILLDKIRTLCREKIPSSQLEIKPVGCLWACRRGCVVAVSSPKKATCLFVDLPPDESAATLLEFIQIYINSRKGIIPWEKFPEVLQSAIFAQIPSILTDENVEELL